MATVYRDFSADTVGVMPDGTDSPWTSETDEFLVAVDAAAVGGRSVAMDARGQRFLRFDDLGTAIAGTVEVVWPVSVDTVAAGTNPANVVCYGSGTASTKAGYVLRLRTNSDASQQLEILRLSTGAQVSLEDAPFTFVVSTFYWLRLRVVDNADGTATVFGKAWPVGNLEPVGWMVEADDAAILADGGLGFGNQGAMTGTWRPGGMATEGDTAPIAATDVAVELAGDSSTSTAGSGALISSAAGAPTAVAGAAQNAIEGQLVALSAVGSSL